MEHVISSKGELEPSVVSFMQECKSMNELEEGDRKETPEFRENEEGYLHYFISEEEKIEKEYKKKRTMEKAQIFDELHQPMKFGDHGKGIRSCQEMPEVEERDYKVKSFQEIREMSRCDSVEIGEEIVRNQN